MYEKGLHRAVKITVRKEDTHCRLQTDVRAQSFPKERDRAYSEG